MAYRLISDFNLRGMILDSFGLIIDAFNQATKRSDGVVLQNAYMAPWLTNIVVGSWIAGSRNSTPYL